MSSAELLSRCRNFLAVFVKDLVDVCILVAVEGDD